MNTGFSFSVIGHIAIMVFLVLVSNDPFKNNNNRTVFKAKLVSTQNKSRPLKKMSAINSSNSNHQKKDVANEPSYKSSSVPINTNGTISTLKMDMENFPFDYYLQLLDERIRENWAPDISNEKNNKRTAVIIFLINKDGSINEISIKRRSGMPNFDQMALDAIYKLRKMPPLPMAFSKDFMSINVEFEAIK